MAEPGPRGPAPPVNSQLTEAVGDARVLGRDPLWVTGVRRAAATPHNALWRHVG